MWVDKRGDVGDDYSKSNSAIIHTGYDAKPGTLESEDVAQIFSFGFEIQAEKTPVFGR